MAEIGTFTRTETGYAGKLHSFGLRDKLFIVPAKPSAVKNAPDYRLRLDSEDGPDAGPHGKTQRKCRRLRVHEAEGPIFPFPIRAKLFQSNDDPSVWTLRWKHPGKSRTRNDGRARPARHPVQDRHPFVRGKAVSSLRPAGHRRPARAKVGRPSAGACLPLTAASTLAGWCRAETGRHGIMPS